jgi:hypothetical protein
MLHAFERKILRMYGSAKEKRHGRHRWNSVIYIPFKNLNIIDDIKMIRLGWAGHIMRTDEERIPEKF